MQLSNVLFCISVFLAIVWIMCTMFFILFWCWYLKSSRETDCWPILEQTPEGMEIAIVRAENSDRWDPDTVQRLESLGSRKVDGAGGKVSVHVLPKSGHWVHVDNPKGLLDIVTPHVATLVWTWFYHIYAPRRSWLRGSNRNTRDSVFPFIIMIYFAE